MSDEANDEIKGQHLPWNEGLPTRPDVDALLKQWPPDTIEPGQWSVTDNEVRALIGNPADMRFRTVYSAWIRRLQREHAVTVYRNKMHGFYCPEATETYARTNPAVASAGKILGKQLRAIAISKPVDDAGRVTKEHQGKLLYVSRRELRKARMNLLPSTATAKQPQIAPPTAASKE